MSDEKDIARAAREYLAKIGKKGGEAKGKRKARPAAHYRAAAAKRWAKARKANVKATKP
jgi:hypothetical protein